MAGIQIDGANQKLYFDSDADTYFEAGTDDVVNVYVGGNLEWKFSANAINVLSGTTLTIDSGATITNSGTSSGFGAITALNNATANELVTVGSTTTQLDAESNLTFDGTDVLVGGAGKVQLRDTGLYVASNADGDLDIVSDGTAVDSINLESAGGITLDAGTAGSGVIFEDDGTEMARLYNSSSDVILETKVSDKDFKIKGNDGGSAITALTLDMSAAGIATFNNDIVSNTGSVRNRPNSRPLLYNGDMAVAQRSASVTGITNGSSGYHTVDRWKWSEIGAPTVVHTMTQEALTADEAFEDGFATAVKLDVTTADASLAAADYIILEQSLEGFDVQLIKKGSSTAEKLTLAFWVKSTKTGTLIAELFDADNNRTCSTAYTIDSTNTWEFKVLNFPADTSGAFTNDNNKSLAVGFWLGAGSDYNSGTLATAWASQTDANRAVGCINTTDSTSNNVHITGVQLEVGEYTSSTLPPFQHESYGDNKQRCQRYYQKFGGGGYEGVATGRVAGTTSCKYTMVYNTPMRADAPSFAEVGQLINTDRASYDSEVTGFGTTATGINSAYFSCSNSGEDLQVVGQAVLLGVSNGVDGWLTFDSEL